MATLAELVVKLVGDISGFTKSMGDAEKAAEQTSNSILGMLGGGLRQAAGVAAGVAVAGFGAATAAAGALGKASLDAAMMLDEAYDTIAIGTGATGEVLEQLQEDFKAVFTSMPVSAKDAASAIAELNTKLGLTGKPLQDVSRAMLQMNSLLGGDVLANSQAFGRLVGDWSIPLDQSVTVLDKLFVASQATGIGVDKLMQSLVQFGSPMRLMGFTLDQSIALLSKWEKEGVNAELVLGSLRIAAGKFAREQIPLQEGLRETIARIQSASSSSEALAIAMEVFGAKAGPDMAAAILEGRFAIDDLVAALQNSQGAIAATAEATADFPEKLEMLKNRVSVLLEPLGAAIMDHIGNALDFVLDIMGDIEDGFGEAGVVGAISNGVHAIATALGISSEDARRFAQGVHDALRQVESAFASVVAWVRDNWPQIRLVLEQVFNAIKVVVDTVVVPLAILLISVFERVVAWVRDNWPLIQRIVEAVFGAIRVVVETVAPVLLRVITSTFTSMQGVIDVVMTAIGGIIRAALQALNGDWAGAWETIKATLIGIWNGIKTFFAGLPATLIGFGRDLIQGFINGIVSMAGALRSAILNLLPPALRSLAAQLGISSPSRLAMWYGEMFMRGLELGFERHAELPQIALKGIVADVEGAAATLGSGADARAQTTTPTAVITLNFYGKAEPEQVRDATVDALRRAGLVVFA